MSLHVKKIDVVLWIMLLLPDRFFYLVNNNAFKSMFKISYDDFVLLCYCLFFAYVCLRYRIKFFSKSYQFKYQFLTIIPLTMAAAIVPHKLFGQSLSAGWAIQRSFLVLVLAYYSFRTLQMQGAIAWNKILHMMYCIGVITLILCVLQYFLYGNITFMTVAYRTRVGLRMRCNYAYPMIVFIQSIIVLLNKGTFLNRIKAFCVLGLVVFFQITISQTRLLIIGYSVAAIILIFINHGQITARAALLIALVCVAVAFVNTDLGQYLVSSLTNVNSNASANIREIGKKYYFAEIAKSPLFGRGYPHESSASAYVAAGFNLSIKLNDNGLFGFAYIYGIAGVIWYVILYAKMIVRSFRAKIEGDYLFLAYIALTLIIAINIVFWYWDFTSGILLVLIITAMEKYDKPILRKELTDKYKAVKLWQIRLQ